MRLHSPLLLTSDPYWQMQSLDKCSERKENPTRISEKTRQRMEPFTPELLTILVLISTVWTGITCLAVIVGLIIFLCKTCSKQTRTDTVAFPIRSHSLYSTPSIPEIVSPVPAPTSDPKKRFRREQARFNPHPHSFYNDRNRSEYPSDKNNETIAKADERSTYDTARRYRALEPVTTLPGLNRGTPYPPDVLARERWMNENRFGSKPKY